jgi:hypothetical protein
MFCASASFLRYCLPILAQRFGHAAVPFVSSLPSQHASSQMPSLTRDEGMKAGRWPSLMQ